jgi:NAD-specific glutamate dehydrogenase
MDIRAFDRRVEAGIDMLKLYGSERYNELRLYNKPGFDLNFIHATLLELLEDTQTIFQEANRHAEALLRKVDKLEQENAELKTQLEECDKTMEEEQTDHLKWLEDQKVIFAGAVDYTAKKAVEAFKETLIEKIKNM